MVIKIDLELKGLFDVDHHSVIINLRWGGKAYVNKQQATKYHGNKTPAQMSSRAEYLPHHGHLNIDS